MEKSQLTNKNPNSITAYRRRREGGGGGGKSNNEPYIEPYRRATVHIRWQIAYQRSGSTTRWQYNRGGVFDQTPNKRANDTGPKDSHCTTSLMVSCLCSPYDTFSNTSRGLLANKNAKKKVLCRYRKMSLECLAWIFTCASPYVQ